MEKISIDPVVFIWKFIIITCFKKTKNEINSPIWVIHSKIEDHYHCVWFWLLHYDPEPFSVLCWMCITHYPFYSFVNYVSKMNYFYCYCRRHLCCCCCCRTKLFSFHFKAPYSELIEQASKPPTIIIEMFFMTTTLMMMIRMPPTIIHNHCGQCGILFVHNRCLIWPRRIFIHSHFSKSQCRERGRNYIGKICAIHKICFYTICIRTRMKNFLTDLQQYNWNLKIVRLRLKKESKSRFLGKVLPVFVSHQLTMSIW